MTGIPVTLGVVEGEARVELSHALRVVTAALDADVLQVLAGAEAGFTGRQVARLVGASPEGTRQVLARLVEQGIVRAEPVGSARVYRLNREHLAAPAIAALAGLREELLARLRAMLAGWDPPAVYAALFGSVARGQERPDSDLDVFVLRPAGTGADHPGWAGQVDALTDRVTAWTGNDTRVLQVGADEVDDLAESGGVLDDVLRDGIPLAGSDTVLRALRRAARRPAPRSAPEPGQAPAQPTPEPGQPAPQPGRGSVRSPR